MDIEEDPEGMGTLWVPDHRGENYLTLLRRLHESLRPSTYLEIGCNRGHSLALARCASLAIDPRPQLEGGSIVGQKPLCAIYSITSDAFFARHDPKLILGGAVDIAFLDGMHLCEYLLRDFINVERHCRRNSVIVLHDCLPVEWPMAERKPNGTPLRARHRHAWAGDVWRTALLLKRRRPDLEISAFAAPPTGIVCITNLCPGSVLLAESYSTCVREMLADDLRTLGIGNLFKILDVEPTASIQDPEAISARFWL